NYLLLRVACDLLKCGIAILDRPIEIGDDNGFAGLFDGCNQAPHALFGFLAISDVCDELVVVKRSSIRSGHFAGTDRYPKRGAVLALEPAFEMLDAPKF